MEIIEVKNLGKQYAIGERQPYVALRDVLTNIARSPFGWLKEKVKGENEDFWALKDLNFSVKPGEVLGIVGRNGAGKSTLLKILSQITPPTKGEIKLRGRVGSLLEVGTGFHPELTGRENIYLNGAVLGMRKKEIEKKFDEIVDFAGIEKFLDTPVKRYSSGMYVRLAFAVAAHLEPDILIIDEVLAVGDAEFQKKCLGKMEEVTHEHGRTILFVSHNLNAIANLCSRAIWLDKGMLRQDGPSHDVISSYLKQSEHLAGQVEWERPKNVQQNVPVIFLGVRVKDKEGVVMKSASIEQDFFVELTYEIIRPTDNLCVGFKIQGMGGEEIFSTSDHDFTKSPTVHRKAGTYVATCRIPASLLNKATYSVSLFYHIPGQLYVAKDAVLNFDIEQLSGACITGFGVQSGYIRPRLDWTIEQIH